jgi:hypothetical protein
MSGYVWIRARFDDRCTECDARIEKGELVLFGTETKLVWCQECGLEIEPGEATP